MSHESEPRRDFQPIHGVHYIVDLYAMLKVPRDADEPIIKGAWRNRMLEYHPDRLQGLAPEFQNRAAQVTNILNQANGIFSDPELRTRYDAMLTDWKGPVSTDGQPVMSIKDIIYGALSPEDARKQVDETLKKLEGLSGFNPVLLKFFEEQYKTNPSPEIEAALQDQLFRQQVDISMKEDTRKDALGVKTSDSMMPPPDYLGETKALVAARREELGQQVERLALAAEQGELRMLAPEVPVDPTTETGLAVSRYQEQVLEQYDVDAAEIEVLAAERQAIMDRRLELVRGEYIGEQPVFHDRLMVYYDMGGQGLHKAFHQPDPEHVNLDESVPAQDFALMDNPEGVQILLDRGFNSMVVKFQEGLPLNEMLQSAVMKHFDAYDKQEEEKARPTEETD